MPTKEIDAAIVALESQVDHYSKLLDRSITNNEIFAKTKVTLLKLKEVSKELIELRKLKMGENG